MEVAASLRQTITHLFDAVRYSNHARELEEAARSTESNIEAELGKLGSHTEKVFNLISSMKNESEDALRELSEQVGGFLATAKEQAEVKLRRKAKEQLDEYRNTASSERDKALMSLEAYLASDPLPIIENVVQVSLVKGIYEAKSRYECEGGMRYDFRLAVQNSRLFHQELTLSRLGYELKVPVRFSHALLSKTRVPGFERLDQYVLAGAETSGGRILADFRKVGNGAKLKVVISGTEDHGFVGLEYSDRVQAVNIMNDPSLSAHVDLESIKKALGELLSEMTDLSKKKVALLRLSLNEEQALDDLDCNEVLKMVLSVMGPSYRSLVKNVSAGDSPDGAGDELSLRFIQERLKILGVLSKSVSQTLGLQNLR